MAGTIGVRARVFQPVYRRRVLPGGGLMRTTDDEVELLRIDGIINAEPILAALRANGIPSRTIGEALGSVYGLTLDGLGEVMIVVPREDEARARELLAAAEEGELELGEDAIEPAISGLLPRPVDD